MEASSTTSHTSDGRDSTIPDIHTCEKHVSTITNVHTGEKRDSNIPDNHRREKHISIITDMHTGEKHALNIINMHTGENLVTPVHISDVPDDILLLIFTYFTPQQLSSRLAYVSSRWHHLSRHCSVWKRLAMNRISLASAAKLFRTAPLQNLSSLDCEWGRENGDYLVALVSVHCPQLTELALRGELAVSVSSESLCVLADGCPNIARLTLSRVDIINVPACNFILPFRSLNTIDIVLRKLDSVNTYNAYLFGSCPMLQNVRLTILGSVGPAHFTFFLARLRSLLVKLVILEEEFSLGCYQILESCTKLSRVVIFSAEQLCDQGLACLGRMNALKTLYLEGKNGTTMAGLVATFSANSSFLGLKELSLVDLESVNDDVLIAIANNGCALTKLELRGCNRVTIVGFSRLVTQCSNLEELVVHGASLVSACLWPIPNYLPRLRKLFIFTKDGMDAASVSELKQARPEIEVCVNISQ